MLVADELYYADPGDFNDPLDSRPNLEADISTDELEHILSRPIEQRTNTDMTTAASSLKYRGPKTINHIARHSRKRADSLINEIRYNAGNPAYEVDDPCISCLRNISRKSFSGAMTGELSPSAPAQRFR